MKKIIILSLFLFSCTSHGREDCDVFTNPVSCIGGPRDEVGFDGFTLQERQGDTVYLSFPEANPIDLNVEVNIIDNKIFRIRYALTSARGTASMQQFQEFKDEIKALFPQNKWRSAESRDGLVEIYEDVGIKVALFRYSVIMYDPRLAIK